MARHLAAGTELPLWFAGQNYGLAVFETVPAALAPAHQERVVLPLDEVTHEARRPGP